MLDELYRSVDGGRSFEHVPFALDGLRREVYRIAADRNGRLFTIARVAGRDYGRLFVSEDDGDHWTPLSGEDNSWLIQGISVLPDGTILAGPSREFPGFRCSTDAGRTWASRCRRPH